MSWSFSPPDDNEEIHTREGVQPAIEVGFSDFPKLSKNTRILKICTKILRDFQLSNAFFLLFYNRRLSINASKLSVNVINFAFP